jgi:hypothetical protein
LEIKNTRLLSLSRPPRQVWQRWLLLHLVDAHPGNRCVFLDFLMQILNPRRFSLVIGDAMFAPTQFKTSLLPCAVKCKAMSRPVFTGHFGGSTVMATILCSFIR